MKETETFQQIEDGAEMMSDATMQKLIDYLKSVKGWSDSEIVALLQHIAK